MAVKKEKLRPTLYNRGQSAAEGGRYINMSNALARAGHGLTLAEKRIVALAAMKLDNRATPKAELVSSFSAVEYSETFDVDTVTAYLQLKAAATQLYKRSITFYTPAYKRNGDEDTPWTSHMRWVGRVHYHEGEGRVDVHWWHEVVPHLVGLKSQFTKYQLTQASALRSGYSWRLLELLMRFQSSGWAEYKIEDFCVSMDVTEKQKANFNNIRRRIIEPAVKELQEKDGWVIEWKPIKRGRRVHALRFVFARNKQAQLNFPNGGEPC